MNFINYTLLALEIKRILENRDKTGKKKKKKGLFIKCFGLMFRGIHIRLGTTSISHKKKCFSHHYGSN